MQFHSCPVCGRRLWFTLPRAGKRVACPHCGAHLLPPRRTRLKADPFYGARPTARTPKPAN